ncbi:MAG TPA: hypothetical protein VJQ79_00025 [Acidimicrobiia bacterium]|nr:hypothetical protein [Acidimicrobiia bacterium]
MAISPLKDPELSARSADFFGDDEASPFEADVNAVAQAGTTKSCWTTSFCSKNVTGGQMASVLIRALGLE